MIHDRVCERIRFLFEKLLISRDIPVSEDHVLSDSQLGELNIRRIPFDPESLVSASFDKSQDPPLYFQAMTPEELSRHPIVEERPYFPEYKPVPNPYGHWRPFQCAISVIRYLDSYVGSLARENVRPEAVSLVDLRGLDDVVVPNSLLNYTSFTSSHSVVRGRWSARIALEPHRIEGRRVHPHLTLAVSQDFNGREGTMIYGELAPIVDLMHARSQQLALSEEEEEAQQELEALPPIAPPAFDREERFPILLLSFLGPQHARVFYACMDGYELVIRQSRLYSFEREATAPIDLFARLLLSRPLPTA